ncbi:GNAT family N-acetyltransferase [Paenibacillus sp. PR3]|uniref:GNAT family N-acetyltransferase n=1 Tax=Paenibacillus terricola TaxID=2763503 RepID=A0ABR8N295_9BACL|nr:GNAT family N-acetyltransferase [Paenibacillus terricola]MBD3922288.1 GNAT family N-acetyltransferase [Paenibacillus terricola]
MITIAIERVINELQIDELTKQLSDMRPREYWEQCLQEIAENKRVTVIAKIDDTIVGYGHLLMNSYYPYFAEHNIPEINDMGVVPDYRRRGIANLMMDELENTARQRGSRVGIGVGLYRDYGNAQRIYCKRGYVLDGRGIQYANQDVEPGSMVRVDDDLLLYLIKEL